MKPEYRIPPAQLHDFLASLFAGAGMPQDDAAFCAQALVQINLWGIDSHGVLRAPIYLQRLRSGAVNPTPSFRIVRHAGALDILDADNAMGPIAGREGMLRAMEQARNMAVGVSGVINSNHFGAASVYARLALQENMIGIAITNVAPNMAMPGAKAAVVGNNPFSVAVPSFSEFPIVLDISLSNVAGGKILLAQQKGEKVPLDWAIDKNGNPTDDPAEAFAGFFLPVGAHKGYGLALIIEILSGVLTGGAIFDGVKSMYKAPEEPSKTSHLFAAINPLAIMSHDEFAQRMEGFIHYVKSIPTAQPDQKLLLPGEIEYRTAIERTSKGIPVSASLMEELTELGKQMGLSQSVIDAVQN